MSFQDDYGLMAGDMSEIELGDRSSQRREYYTRKVEDYLSRYPDNFVDFIGDRNIIQFGDRLLTQGLSMGYNFATSGAFPIMSDEPFITYSVYSQRVDHFGELLALMEQRKIIAESNITLGITATKIIGEYIDPEPVVSELVMKDGSRQRCVESTEGVMIFSPTSASQAVQIARFLLEEAKKIKGRYVDTDARATAVLADLIEPLGFKRAVANVYEFEKGNIIALRQRTTFKSELWKDFPTLLHHRLYSYLVSEWVGS